MNKQYDIIVCGAGMSGLSMAYKASKSGVWENLSVLIIDKDTKTKNDRTWCFWESSESIFEEIVYHRWEEMLFFNNDGSKLVLENDDYSYKMIRSIDFYNHTLEYLKTQSNITILKESINKISNYGNKVEVFTESNSFTSQYCFNSLYQKPDLKDNDTYLLQHFKGIVIETEAEYFNTKQIHLMDFRTSQENGNTFFYVLPTSDKTALVEYTLFSDRLLERDVYDQRLQEYINVILGIEHYKIIDTEFGVIPMTDYKFNRFDSNIVNIGTVGGDTRGSTGYTFSNTQKTIDKIITSFQNNGTPFFNQEHISRKHKIYDSTMLQVLADGKYKGHQLFADMFSKVKTSDIFAFLDSESTLSQDIKNIKSLIPNYFIKPFFRALKKYYF